MSSIAIPFSEVVRHGDLLVLSGQAAIDLASGEVVGDGVEAQFEYIIERVERLLADQGAGLGDVLRVECFLADRIDFPVWNGLFEAAFPEPRPARTTLITGMVLPAMRIEIQILAARS